MESPVVPKSIVDFDISMPEIIVRDTQAIDTTPETISLIEETPTEVSPISEVSDTMDLSARTHDLSPTPATLEDRIAGFVTDLERLKADDEMLLHEKESAIEKLETETRELTKEIKKIQADEKRIDATIASINTPITKGK
jgi:hypothetical protein